MSDGSDTITSLSRDGVWSYTYGRACGYIVDVTHRPSGRTAQIRGGVRAARSMAKNGALLALFSPPADRVEASMRELGEGNGVLVEELAEHLDLDPPQVREALQMLYAAGLVREFDGGPNLSYRSVWAWTPETPEPEGDCRMPATPDATEDLTEAERKLYDTYLESIAEIAEPIETLRYYAGPLGGEVLDSIRADRSALATWYDRLNAFSSGLANMNGDFTWTPAADRLAHEQANRFFSAQNRFNALVVHWLMEGTPVQHEAPVRGTERSA